MKKTIAMVLTLAALGIGLRATAGIHYKGEVTIEAGAGEGSPDLSPEDQKRLEAMGMSVASPSGFRFEAWAEGGKFKMTYLTPFTFFRKGSYTLGDSTNRTAYFVFPDRRQFVRLDLDELQGGAGRSARTAYSNLSVSTSGLAPTVIHGLPCTGKRVTVSYDVTTSVMGMRSKSHEKTVTDYYTTGKYDAASLFGGHNWHTQGISVGYAPFDKAIVKKVGFLGFPVKIVSRTTTNGRDGGTTTLTTGDVAVVPVPTTTFSLPSGYEETSLGPGLMSGQNSRGRETRGAQEKPSSPSPSDKEPKKEKHRSLRDRLRGILGE